MDANFSHEKNLALINEMISQARENLWKDWMYPMIFWGYTIALLAIANFTLIHVFNNENLSFLVWIVTILVFAVSYFINRKIDHTALDKVHVDKVGGIVWKGFVISIAVLLVVVFTVAFHISDFRLMLLINPIHMVMIGLCEFATACIYRYKPWYWIAILFWVGAISCAFLQVDRQFIILAVCMIMGFVVPGHLTRQQKPNNV